MYRVARLTGVDVRDIITPKGSGCVAAQHKLLVRGRLFGSFDLTYFVFRSVRSSETNRDLHVLQGTIRYLSKREGCGQSAETCIGVSGIYTKMLTMESITIIVHH